MEKKAYKERFIKYAEDFGFDEEGAEEIWFTKNEGCFPEGLIGDDLMKNIIDKFYVPLAFVGDLLRDSLGLPSSVSVTVMPSYEDSTFYTVTYKHLLLEEGDEKAWNFWFANDDEFDRWVEDRLERWSMQLRMEANGWAVRSVLLFPDGAPCSELSLAEEIEARLDVPEEFRDIGDDEARLTGLAAYLCRAAKFGTLEGGKHLAEILAAPDDSTPAILNGNAAILALEILARPAKQAGKRQKEASNPCITRRR